MYELGEQVFISYRGAYAQAAERLKAELERNNACQQATLIPANSLWTEDELVLPYEYAGVMERLQADLAHADAFVFLETPDYWESYFTQAEVLLWRRLKRTPQAYAVKLDGRARRMLAGEQVEWTTLTSEQHRQWSNLPVVGGRSAGGSFALPVTYGKYAKTCFLVPCGACGQHFLATRRVIYSALGGQFALQCPHCQNARFALTEGEQREGFYRKPVLLKQTFRVRLRPLEPEELHALLLGSRLPPQVRLVSLPGERLSSDLANLGKVSVGLGLVGAAALGVVGLLNKLSEQQKKP